MPAKSTAVSAVLPTKPDIADQREKSGAITPDLTMLFQIIRFLRPVGCGHSDDLADRSCGCARAIAVPVERLLLTRAPPPIARGVAGSADLKRGHVQVFLPAGPTVVLSVTP